MDPTEEAVPGGRFETFDANERFVVIRDDDGYGVWRLEQLDEGEPIARFADDDDGYEAAATTWKELTKADRRRRGPWLERFRIVVLVALATWVASSAISTTISIFGEDPFFPGDPSGEGFERSLYVLSAVSFDVWIAATIAYVILWMEGRRRQ